MSEGLTPLILLACPMVCGLILLSFSLASKLMLFVVVGGDIFFQIFSVWIWAFVYSLRARPNIINTVSISKFHSTTTGPGHNNQVRFEHWHFFDCSLDHVIVSTTRTSTIAQIISKLVGQQRWPTLCCGIGQFFAVGKTITKCI